MNISEKILLYLAGLSADRIERIEPQLIAFLRLCISATDIEIWSKSNDKAGQPRYVRTDSKLDSGGRLPDRTLESFKELPITSTIAQIKLHSVRCTDEDPLPDLIVVYSSKTMASIDEQRKIALALNVSANYIYTLIINELNRKINDSAHGSRDLPSFLYKCLHVVKHNFFGVEAASFFYYESKTESLVLGATTGLMKQDRSATKRSDIRYFCDGPSTTARCWREATETVENGGTGHPLPPSAYPELTTSVENRLYFPIIHRGSSSRSESSRPGAILRMINFGCNRNNHSPNAIDMAILDSLGSSIAVYVERYIKTLSVLHDQERATHGYITDLSAIKFAIQNVGKWVTLLSEEGVSSHKLGTALKEVRYRINDILAVQDNMAAQLLMVLYQSGNSKMAQRHMEAAQCNHPYTDVLMRLVAAKRGMSACYARPELKITFNGENIASANFIQIPSLRISVGSLYLVFRNLAENSIKYSTKGLLPKLDIAWRIDDSQRAVEFSFLDEGIGIPNDERNLILREGFRGSRAQELQLRGNGLGLAVALSVLKEVGGDLNYVPHPGDGHGTCFKVSILIQQQSI